MAACGTYEALRQCHKTDIGSKNRPPVKKTKKIAFPLRHEGTESPRVVVMKTPIDLPPDFAIPQSGKLADELLRSDPTMIDSLPKGLPSADAIKEALKRYPRGLRSVSDPDEEMIEPLVKWIIATDANQRNDAALREALTILVKLPAKKRSAALIRLVGRRPELVELIPEKALDDRIIGAALDAQPNLVHRIPQKLLKKSVIEKIIRQEPSAVLLLTDEDAGELLETAIGIDPFLIDRLPKKKVTAKLRAISKRSLIDQRRDDMEHMLNVNPYFFANDRFSPEEFDAFLGFAEKPKPKRKKT
jgi:hypothetical protein